MSEQEHFDSTQEDGPQSDEGGSAADEGAEDEFVEEMESDPSRAHPGEEDDLGQLRGG